MTTRKMKPVERERESKKKEKKRKRVLEKIRYEREWFIIIIV